VAGDGSFGEADAKALAEQLRALGNERRLRLLHFLTLPRSAEAVAAELGIARQNAQEHLQQLLDLGLAQRADVRLPGGAAAFVVVPERLFALQEEFARVGTLLPPMPAQGQRPTMPAHLGVEPPRERDLPRLVLVKGMRLGTTATLTGPGPWTLGRDPAAALSLDYDAFASVRHAEVRRTQAGFEVADLYSSNGTYLDWEALPRGGALPLGNGAIVGVGRSIAVFRKP
jgi:DNA-binding transcriptional ArsR family regulator